MKNKNAFSMIELMIALVIIGILAAIAIPGYQNYIRESRRADVIHIIQALRVAEEKYHLSNDQYGTLAEVSSGFGVPSTQYYTITIPQDSLSVTQYTINAVATTEAGQNKDSEGTVSCSTLTYSVDGNDETKTPAECWD